MVALEGSARPKVDLVLEGGGVKGIGLVGAVLTLSEKGFSSAFRGSVDRSLRSESPAV